jgi:hypothetical protein
MRTTALDCAAALTLIIITADLPNALGGLIKLIARQLNWLIGEQSRQDLNEDSGSCEPAVHVNQYIPTFAPESHASYVKI